MSLSKKVTCIGTLRQVFICLRPSPLPMGLCSNFVGSESGQKQSAKLLHIWSPTQLNIPPSQPLTVCIYYILTLGRGGVKGVNQRG
jgi:hypothetical protein